MGTTVTVWVPLVTAGLGLVTGIGAAVGTAVLTQRRTDRREDVRWQREGEERQLQWEREREERVTEERKLAFVERRAAYAAVNRASRDFLDALKFAVHRLRDGAYTNQQQAETERVRREYRGRYAEAQMYVSESMLNLSRDINTILAEVDAVVKRIVEGIPNPGGSPESLRVSQLKDAEGKIREFTRIMRADLGLTDEVIPESHDGRVKSEEVKQELMQRGANLPELAVADQPSDP